MWAWIRAGGFAVGLWGAFLFGVREVGRQFSLGSGDADRGRVLFERVWKSSTTLTGGDGLGRCSTNARVSPVTIWAVSAGPARIKITSTFFRSRRPEIRKRSAAGRIVFRRFILDSPPRRRTLFCIDSVVLPVIRSSANASWD